MKAARLLVAILLIPPWFLFLLACYWWFIDSDPPVVINYQHPQFLDAPVKDRVEAQRHSITEIVGGSTVWAYSEFCVMRQMTGNYFARWSANGFSWPVDDRGFSLSPVGCHQSSRPIAVPTSNPSRDVLYHSFREFQMNPLRSVTVTNRPIPITIKANQ